MSVDSFAKWAGESAVVNCELGAQLAWRAILDLLERHGMWQAREVVEAGGPDAIAAAWAHEAWKTEDSQPAGVTAATTNKSA